jgi:hypothetical protein
MRKLIRTDGTEEPLIGPLSMTAIRALIGADVCDHVTLSDRVHVMILDDLGHKKGLPVNAKATALYHARCIPGTTHQIRGDVVIVPDSDF